MPIQVERTDAGVVTITLDSPERRNALDEELATQLRQAVRDVAADPGARCAVITGAGRAFCSGADLGEFRRQESGGVLPRREMLGAYYRTFLDVRDLAVPTIAAVNGPAIGAGLNLALVCDLRIAGASARFGATFVRLGIHPGGGATYMLARLLGPARAAEMLLGGELVDGARALEMGLVNRLVDDADLAATAAALAATIAANAPRAVRATKRALRLALDADMAAMLEVEGLAQAATQESADAGEGWAAFRERRAPRFAE
ncbi:MAG: enoyl-CoA hydratase/isomerase family protein [Chloroflexi bacterium]|nr:MAG: enoyl-CoA hydratase/isomerase family protein [Chloroflexota bacterium]